MSDEPAAGRTCPWCSAAAPEAATTCPACGAALAQRESIGGLAIPGVTTVDPTLQAIDGQPMRIPGASPSQRMASGVAVAAAIGGPVALAAMGGLAAVAAAEYIGAGRAGVGRPADLADVGRPSAVTLQALERLEGRGDHEVPTGVGDASPDDPSPDQPDSGDKDPWRDLPGGVPSS